MTTKIFLFTCSMTAMALAASAHAQSPSQVAAPAEDQVVEDQVAGDQVAAAPQDTQPAKESGADIVVTGSRIARNGFDTSTPVAVTTAEDITLSGQPNVERALQELPQVATGGTNAFSNAVTGSSGGYADLNLRSFGSNRNLVLVNGRRYAIINAAQITDTNTIPASLIERTEIVTGGSSAVYGSDAITGVVNFILKDRFEGLEARYQLNMIPQTATPTYNVDLTFGKNFAGDRGNITVALNYLNRGGNLRRDFKSWENSFVLADACIVPGSGSATQPGTRLTVPAGQNCQQAGGMIGYAFNGSADVPNGRIFGIPSFGGSNAALDAAYVAAGLSGLTTDGFTFDDRGATPRLFVSERDGYNGTGLNNLQTPQERYMANTFGHFDVSNAATIYVEGHYSRNKVIGQLAPANYNAPTLLNVDNPYLNPQLRAVLTQLDLAESGERTVTHGITSFTTTPGDGLAVVNLGRRFTDLGPRRSINTRDVYRGAIGVRGEIGDLTSGFLTNLKYDAYYTYSNASESILIVDGVSKSRLQQNLLSVNGAAPVCNEFGQNLDDACRTAIRVNALAQNKAELHVAQASLTGTIARLPAGGLGFSLGVEWRRTSAEFIPDATLSTGDAAGYSGSLPTNGRVSAKEVFGEVRVPLIHDTFLIQSLTANAGFRGSDYSLGGVGTVWTYFYGADWAVSRDLTFRGQYQRAIRAPSVGELFGGTNTGSFTLIDPCSNRAAANQQTADVRALCVATGVPAANVFTQAVQPAPFIYGLSGGNPDLAAEVADTYTAGLVFTPTFLPRFYLSVDYFDIKVNGAISQLGGGGQNTFNLCYYVVKDASSQYCQAIGRDGGTGEILDSNPARFLNANTGGLQTRGVDFALNYRQPLGTPFGTGVESAVTVRSNYTYLLDFTATPVQDLPIRNECAGAFGSTCNDAKPRWRGTTRLSWQIGDVTLSGRHRFIGPVTTDRYLVPLRQGSAATPQLSDLPFPRIAGQHYFDLSFDARVANRMRLTGGVNNVFDRDIPSTSSLGFYDPMGAEIFLGAAIDL